MTSNANQQICKDNTAKKRSFDSGLSCATSNAANSMTIVNGRQDILGDLLLMPTTAPALAGDLELAVANLVAFAWRNEFFPTATKAVMNTIAVVLLIISLLLYNKPDQSIITITIPRAEIATDPAILTQLPIIEASIERLSQNLSSIARTPAPTRSSSVSLTLTRSCSSVSVDKTVVVGLELNLFDQEVVLSSLSSPCVATPLAVQGTEGSVERLAQFDSGTRENTDHHTRSGTMGELSVLGT